MPLNVNNEYAPVNINNCLASPAHGSKMTNHILEWLSTQPAKLLQAEVESAVEVVAISDVGPTCPKDVRWGLNLVIWRAREEH
ncbi:uncharacterized protein LOC143252265 isoform X2 [Tachypleus tridentatus]|uniref:uncharacterized protein LOC143252265 isoform X2 n=1 Tax=Tachypleus tridentatus TaxID=6853 RepID=UPI003FCF9C28